MIEVPLTQGKIALIDDIDGDLLDYKWHSVNWKGNFYATKNRNNPMHKVILGRILDRELLQNEYADHINLDTLDNRRCNLRLATQSLNQANRRKPKNNTSGYKGVYFNNQSNKYIAQICVKSKRIYLGSFDDPKEAYEAYCKAAIQYFGDFARFE